MTQNQFHAESASLEWSGDWSVNVGMDFSDAVVVVAGHIFDAFGRFSGQLFQFLREEKGWGGESAMAGQ
jgi:hypothetical protein